MKQQLIAAILLAMCSAQMQAQVTLKADNIDQVLKSMTLEEKATLCVGYSHAQGDAGSANNGMIGAHADMVPGAAGATRPIPRLGIPATVLSDGPAGLRISPKRNGDTNTYYATGFPVGTALACTWNTELVQNVGSAIGNEVHEYGCDVLLAPGMNIHRSPLCGRNFEYYSEDPLVAGKIAAAYVKGVQSQGVGVSMKHFAVNSQETNRMGVNEVVSQRALREIYLKGFEIAVREANPWTIMSSYNKVNGPFTQENRELLTTILRDEWGFKGIVMTDWTGLRNTAAQIHAGNDLMEPGNQSQINDILAKVKSGDLLESDLDICVKRILEYIVKSPHFKGYKYSNKPDLQAHAAVTRQSATEGMVLLKNERQTLPMAETLSAAVFGVTSYDFIAGGTGSGDVNKAYTIDLMTGLTNAGIKVNKTLSDLYAEYKVYQQMRQNAERQQGGWFWGKPQLPEMPVSRNLVERVSNETDIALITIGRQAGEGSDRRLTDDFNLTEVERQLISDVCEAYHMKHKRVVVILNMGNVIETSSWKGQPDAILMAWQPGQEGGNSVADVLLGKENPSGKLSMTFPNTLIDLPSSFNFPNIGTQPMGNARGGQRAGGQRNTDYTIHAEGLNVGYRWFNTQHLSVSYPFGFGLSYTTFAYSCPQVKATKDGFEAAVTVTNTGKVAGKEAVQLYVNAPSGGLEKPERELKSFAKTHSLRPGESQTLTFPVSLYDLASYNEATQSWETAAGTYTLYFSANVEDPRCTATYRLGKASVVKCHDVMRPDMEIK